MYYFCKCHNAVMLADNETKLHYSPVQGLISYHVPLCTKYFVKVNSSMSNHFTCSTQPVSKDCPYSCEIVWTMLTHASPSAWQDFMAEITKLYSATSEFSSLFLRWGDSNICKSNYSAGKYKPVITPMVM